MKYFMIDQIDWVTTMQSDIAALFFEDSHKSEFAWCIVNCTQIICQELQIVHLSESNVQFSLVW